MNMDDFKNHSSGEIIEAMRQASVARQRERALEEVAKSWILDFESEVVRDSDGALMIQTVAKKPDGTGLRMRISHPEVVEYAGDPETLFETLADKIVDQLYRPQIRKLVAKSLGPTLANANSMSNGVLP